MADKNILEYLGSTKDLFLVYGEEDLQINRYVDTSFQSDKDNCKSQSGFIYIYHYE